ncbi:hypothetical protein MRX96_009701 [Rhipicephalus microplus]
MCEITIRKFGFCPKAVCSIYVPADHLRKSFFEIDSDCDRSEPELPHAAEVFVPSSSVPNATESPDAQLATEVQASPSLDVSPPITVRSSCRERQPPDTWCYIAMLQNRREGVLHPTLS